MTRSRDQILRTLEANRDTVRSFGARRLGLFGSRARGENNPASDLDFVVELDRKSFDDYMGLKEFLEDLFGCPVDLVLADAIKPRLRAAILSEAVYASGL